MTTGGSDTALYNCWVTCCTKYQVKRTIFYIFIGQKCIAHKTLRGETFPSSTFHFRSRVLTSATFSQHTICTYQNCLI